MSTTSRVRPAMAGWRASAAATLVSGPVGTSVMSSPSAISVRTRKSTAGSACTGTAGSPNSTPSSPEAPWISPAVICGRTSGRQQPA